MAMTPETAQKIREMFGREAEEMLGYWPLDCQQRAFVDGAKWWQFYGHGSTMFPSEQDEASVEAIRRYGDPGRRD